MAIAEITQLTVQPGEIRGKSFTDGGVGVLFKIFGSETGGTLAVVEHPVAPHAWSRRILMPTWMSTRTSSKAR